MSRSYGSWGGTCLVVVLVLGAVAGPWVSPYSPTTTQLLQSHQGPSWAHPCGTDELGRDVLTRVLYGGRISLTIGIASRVVALVIGGLLGVLAGYYGGWLDACVMRMVDMTLGFPLLLLALALAAVLGPWLEQGLTVVGWQEAVPARLVALMVALGLVGWAELARLVRGQVLATRHQPYVEAARACGSGDRRIIVLHILPNCASPVIVWLSLGMAAAIMAEAGLSYLGLGVAQPTPSWGGMINAGLIEMRRAPWLTIAPGVALAATVLGFNLLGDGLRDRLDPRAQG